MSFLYPANPQSKIERDLKSEYFIYLEAQKSPLWKEADYDGFKLPGQEEAKEYCQKWISYGCDNTNEHPHGKHYFKHEQKSCKKASCEKCNPEWMGRQSNRTARRMGTFFESARDVAEYGPAIRYNYPIYKFRHVTLSPPQHEAINMNYKQLKKWLDFALKKANIKTACIVFHPFRFLDSKKTQPYLSPHFHCFVYGKITNTTEFHNKTKWLIFNHRDLKNEVDYFSTVRYLLSHAGIRKRTHTVRYLGLISYRKLSVEKEPDSHICPYCDMPLTIFKIVLTAKTKPPPIYSVSDEGKFIGTEGLWDKSCFTRIEDIDEDTKIPFYKTFGPSDYAEELIYSFEELLLLRINNGKITMRKYEESLLFHKTAKSSRNITEFCSLSS